MTKTCIFCNLTWIVSALNKSSSYTCPKCEKFLQTHKGKTVARNKARRAKSEG
jgi:uncharacterized paraquat-inducible protein A